MHKLRHAIPIMKPLPSIRKKSVNQVEAIVLNLFISWILHALLLKLMFEVITDIMPEFVP